MNASKQPARMGRPPRFPDEGPRIGHSLRLKPSIDKVLREAAEKNNRSLAEEMEHRINVSFEREAVTYGSNATSRQSSDSIFPVDVERIIAETTLQAEYLELDRQLAFAHTKIFICIEKMENLILRNRIAERGNALSSFIQSSSVSKKIGLAEIFARWFKVINDTDLSITKLQINAVNLEHEMAQEERDMLRVKRREKFEQIKKAGMSPWNGSRKRLVVGDFLKKIYAIEDMSEDRPNTK